MQEPLKILVVRFSSIGDIVLTTPVVRMLKKQLNAQVHYLTKSSYVSLLENNPYIDSVYQIETSKLFKSKARHATVKKGASGDVKTSIIIRCIEKN